MAQGNPMPGEKYLHFKNRMYQVIAVAYHSETMEPYVVYQALYGDFKTYIRPYDMFVSEVDHEKYPEVKQRYRFQYMQEAGLSRSTVTDATDGAETNERELPDSEESTEINGEELSDTGEPEKAGSGETVNVNAEKQSDTGKAVSVDSETQSDAGEQAENEEAGKQQQRPQRVLKILRAEEKRKVAPDAVISVADDPEGKMNPWLEKFLDAKDFEEKYKIVCDMQRDITDRLVDDIAVVMDLAIPEGNLIERYGQLKYCMRTMQKYEMGRLR